MNRYIFSAEKQRGDTIIEVLLAMAVLGMVLGTSFGIVNRSLATGRDAQERSEATKLAESQLEKLKTASSDPNNKFFDDSVMAESKIYCITDTLAVVTNTDTDPMPENGDLESYNSGCMTGPDGRYRMSIVRSGNIFTVRTRWNSIRGEQLNEAKVTYRTYEYSTREYPVVSTNQTVIVSGPSATVTGRVTDQGKSPVSSRGFIYNTVARQHPSSGTLVQKDSGLGDFATTLSLATDTVYYVRAYATNGSGTSYGSEVKFSTEAILIAVLGNIQVTNVSINSATVKATVSEAGVTRRGIIIGAPGRLELDSTNSFSSTIETLTGNNIDFNANKLLPNTTYEVKGFATNEFGTSYSNATTFTTNQISNPFVLQPPVIFNGHTYYYSNETVSWSTARSIASANGGHLVTINDDSENKFIATLTAKSLTWAGLNDKVQEGTYVWDNGVGDIAGDGYTYTNWYPGEPNNYLDPGEGGPGVDEDVVVLNWVPGDEQGRWNDWYDEPDATARYIIEYDSVPYGAVPTISIPVQNFKTCNNIGSLGCVKTPWSVYSCADYGVEYDVPSSGPGYNTIYIEYDDMYGNDGGDTPYGCAPAPTPPDELYKFNINIKVNGVANVSNYKLNPSGGFVAIPLNGVIPSIESITVEWTNNQWVPLNTYSYDPDFNMYSIRLGYQQ